MENKEKDAALANFLAKNAKAKDKAARKVVIDEREGLIERVDKVYITKEGKQLLREQY